MITRLFGKKKTTSSSRSTKGSDDFVSLSSHELRSPLSIIKWYTEILLDEDAGPLTEDQRKYLSVIESSNQRAIDLVRSLLNVSRLDLDTFSISPCSVSIPSVAKEAIQSLSEYSSKKNITATFEEKEGVSDIQADKHLCLMLLKNVISNAVFFSKDGSSVAVTVSRVLSGSSIEGEIVPEESLLIKVTDTGIGIPDEDKNKIFSKMYKASNVKDSESTGSGLGLYITKAILDYVGGKIWFISTLGSGSTFFFTLPVRGMEKKDGRTTLD